MHYISRTKETGGLLKRPDMPMQGKLCSQVLDLSGGAVSVAKELRNIGSHSNLLKELISLSGPYDSSEPAPRLSQSISLRKLETQRDIGFTESLNRFNRGIKLNKSTRSSFERFSQASLYALITMPKNLAGVPLPKNRMALQHPMPRKAISEIEALAH